MGSHTKKWRLKKIAQLSNNGIMICHYCKCILQFNEDPGRHNFPTLDHVIPHSQGGRLDMDNLVLACYWCNHHRGDMSVAQWLNHKKLATRKKMLLTHHIPNMLYSVGHWIDELPEPKVSLEPKMTETQRRRERRKKVTHRDINRLWNA